MTKKREIYRCAVCGNVTEVMNEGHGTLVCCGRPMERMVGNTTDASQEKHVPVVEKVEGGYLVKVGTTAHPMLEDHYIQWIELHTPLSILFRELRPGDKPEVFFRTTEEACCVPAFCNLHGMWNKKQLQAAGCADVCYCE